MTPGCKQNQLCSGGKQANLSTDKDSSGLSQKPLAIKSKVYLLSFNRSINTASIKYNIIYRVYLRYFADLEKSVIHFFITRIHAKTLSNMVMSFMHGEAL